MHLLFDARIHLPHITGISKYIIYLLDELARQNPGWKITVLINDQIKEEDVLIKRLAVYNNIQFKTVSLPHFGPVNYLLMPFIIRSLKPDIYHYPHIDAPISGVPTVVTIHDANIKKGIKKFADKLGIKSMYFKLSLKLSLKFSRAVIFISNSVKEEILKQTGEADSKKFNVIYNGFPSDYATYPNSVDKETKLKYDLPDEYFLFVGQLRSHKNIFRVIQAYEGLNTDMPLVLVGYNYSNLNFTNKNIRYIGMVDDLELKSIYKHSFCFLFPSLIEGFGFPILEAFSFGIPVITTNTGATAEVANNNALLVNPYSVKDIQEKMQMVLDGYKPDVAGMQTRIKAFTWEANAKELRKVYLKALKK